MQIIRWILGRIILVLDWATRPSSEVERTPEQQRAVEQELEGLTIYELYTCPFCVKLRRACLRLNLPIQRRNVKTDLQARSELEQQGGKFQVPCLRIEQPTGEVLWMYESKEITDYLYLTYGSKTDALSPT